MCSKSTTRESTKFYFRHIEKCITEVIERKNSLVEEIEQTVEMINRNNITQQVQIVGRYPVTTDPSPLF